MSSVGEWSGRSHSNLYLRRTKERLLLSTEHRAAPASPPVYLELVTTDATTTHLEVVTEPRGDKRPSLQEQVLEGAADAKGLRSVDLIQGSSWDDVLSDVGTGTASDSGNLF